MEDPQVEDLVDLEAQVDSAGMVEVAGEEVDLEGAAADLTAKIYFLSY